MKKAILLAVIGLVAWSYYEKGMQQGPSVTPERKLVSESNRAPDSGFKCDGRQYCSQMTSRAEAEFFLKNCPSTKMDGDHDGIPCENDSRF